MANVTTLASGSTTGVGPSGTKSLRVWQHEIDIADFVTAGGLTTEYAVVVNIPADTYFTLEQVEVVDALSLGAGARIDIGDSADDDEFVTNATTLTADTNLTLAKVNGSSGNVYTAADTLRLKITGGTIASGVLRFVGTMASTARNAAMTV
jgi:hypothetical protein